MRPTTTRVGAALLVCVIAMPVRAQNTPSLERCRSIEERSARLACYDVLAGASEPSPPIGQDFRSVSVDDLTLDFDSLRGHSVQVPGRLLVIGGMVLLKSDARNTALIRVDYKAVPREQRAALLQRCGFPGCEATVRGKVDRVFEQPGIVADSVEVR